jgi:hypothetical protein
MAGDHSLWKFHLLSPTKGFLQTEIGLSRGFGVANPVCSSRIPDPNFFHPGSKFFPSRIPDMHQRT